MTAQGLSRRAVRTPKVRCRCAASLRTHGDCTTCTVMSLSGRRIAGTLAINAARRHAPMGTVASALFEGALMPHLSEGCVLLTASPIPAGTAIGILGLG